MKICTLLLVGVGLVMAANEPSSNGDNKVNSSGQDEDYIKKLFENPNLLINQENAAAGETNQVPSEQPIIAIAQMNQDLTEQLVVAGEMNQVPIVPPQVPSAEPIVDLQVPVQGVTEQSVAPIDQTNDVSALIVDSNGAQETKESKSAIHEAIENAVEVIVPLETITGRITLPDVPESTNNNAAHQVPIVSSQVPVQSSTNEVVKSVPNAAATLSPEQTSTPPVEQLSTSQNVSQSSVDDKIPQGNLNHQTAEREDLIWGKEEFADFLNRQLKTPRRPQSPRNITSRGNTSTENKYNDENSSIQLISQQNLQPMPNQSQIDLARILLSHLRSGTLSNGSEYVKIIPNHENGENTRAHQIQNEAVNSKSDATTQNSNVPTSISLPRSSNNTGANASNENSNAPLTEQPQTKTQLSNLLQGQDQSAAGKLVKSILNALVPVKPSNIPPWEQGRTTTNGAVSVPNAPASTNNNAHQTNQKHQKKTSRLPIKNTRRTLRKYAKSILVYILPIICALGLIYVDFCRGVFTNPSSWWVLAAVYPTVGFACAAIGYVLYAGIKYFIS